MNDIEVKIVSLEPMRVAVAHGFGSSPELEAWHKIVNYLKSRGRLDQLEGLRFFGYNNPNPSPGSPNYGYDQWVTIGDDEQVSDDLKAYDFPGGKYAVTSFQGLNNITTVWGRLVQWHEDHGYQKPPNYLQCLEELINPGLFILPDGELDETEAAMEQLVFKLYLPVAE
jgi:effector-binding domain-containing protein